MDVTYRDLNTADVAAVLAAVELFDHPPQRDPTERFLASDTHHLIGAFAGDRMVGFVTGVELTHPDKGTEMLLYELGVAASHRRLGIGTALVERLRRRAVDAGCYGIWVLTDVDNHAAQATYRAAGLTGASTTLMLDGEWSGPADE